MTPTTISRRTMMSKCKTCGGNGEIYVLKKEEPIFCPTCKGTGKNG